MSLGKQKPHGFDLEILIMLNGEDYESKRYLADYQDKNKNIQYLEKKEAMPIGQARNELIKMASGEYLCFLDDDVEISESYFSRAQNIIEHYNKNIDVFGGPDQTKQLASDFQLILGEVMQTFLAMGPTARRHRTDQKKEHLANEVSLILCNLWIKKEIFGQGLNFPKGYMRNEENILLGRLEKAGKTIMYVPQLVVYHERKNSFKKVIKATFSSGMYRTYGFFDERQTLRWYFLIPQILVLLSVLSFFYRSKLFFYEVIAYIFLVFLHSLYVSYKVRKLEKFYLGMFFYFIYNLVYVTGMFYGYIKAIGKK